MQLQSHATFKFAISDVIDRTPQNTLGIRKLGTGSNTKNRVRQVTGEGIRADMGRKRGRVKGGGVDRIKDGKGAV